jgi:aminopeptidase N
VLRMPYATAEGSLAHELVHNWWGNYVYVDWDTGNWCEGLTYFSTNYYWNILDGRPDDAEHFRFRSMVKYSVEVAPNEDYPVREFRTKWTAEDGDIGYDKASAIFIMLHEKMGREKFFEACRLAVERYGGKKTSWDDLQAVFEEVAEEDLSDFFSSWLDNSGTPVLEIMDQQVEEVDETFHLIFILLQRGFTFYFDLPMFVTFDGVDTTTEIPVFTPSQRAEVTYTKEPTSIQFDPDYYVFRRLTRDEIPPCLNVTMEGDSVLVVLPSGGESDTLQTMSMMGGGPSEVSVKAHYEGLAQSIAQGQSNVTVKYDNEVSDEDLADNSVLCLGAARYNSLTERLGSEIGENVTITDSGFSVDGTEYDGEGTALLTTVRNPYNPDRDITFYLGNSPGAVSRAAMIFFYGWDSYVVYENGSLVDRGEWDMGRGPLYFEF